MRREVSNARAESAIKNSPIRRLMDRNAELKALLVEALPYVEMQAVTVWDTDAHDFIENDLIKEIKEAIK